MRLGLHTVPRFLGSKALRPLLLAPSLLSASCGQTDDPTEPVSTGSVAPSSSLAPSTGPTGSSTVAPTTGSSSAAQTTAATSNPVNPEPSVSPTTAASSLAPTTTSDDTTGSSGGTGGTSSTASSATGTSTSTGSAEPTSSSGDDTTSVDTGSQTSGGAQGDACPDNASFCSGFEDAELPEGAVFKVNGDPASPWTTNFEVDSTQKKSGASSLRVKSMSEAGTVGAYKMLAVPSGGSAFWVRMYVRSDSELGVHDHNAIAIAAASDDPNGGGVEFAEDVGLSFNTQDDVRWPEGFGRLMAGGEMPYSVDPDAWHCVELHFDGPGRIQQLYIEGEELINATAYPSQAITFTTFKFGYNALHGTARNLWFDDMVVAPTRVGCLDN